MNLAKLALLALALKAREKDFDRLYKSIVKSTFLSLSKVAIYVLVEILSAHHFINVAKRMEMAIFVKLRQVVARALVSVMQIDAVHAFLFLNVWDVLIIP